MKQLKYFLWCILVIFVFSACRAVSDTPNSVKPQKVLRIVYKIYPNEWYVQQEKLWKKEIDKNPRNTEAWYNYYNAVRYAKFEESFDTKEKKDKLNKIIEDMGKAIPGTYEYYLLKHWTTHNIWDMSTLEKAYQLNPERPDTYYEFILHYQVSGNEQKVKEFYEKLYESRDIAPWLINYNYNVLMSTKKNAILFTNGDNDTYPARMLQVVKGIRKDVTILNVSLSPIKSYIEEKLKKKGIIINIDELKQKAKEGGADQAKKFSLPTYIQEICKVITEKYPDFPVYFALTVYKAYYKPFDDDMYIVGLAYRYSPSRIDNTALLKKNFEDKFRLDYLKYDWYDEKYTGIRLMAQINMNYAIPMIMLAEHYKTSGQDFEAEKWKKQALEIAKEAGKKEQIEKYIEEKGL